MNCTNCGAPIREGDKFCLKCGRPAVPPERSPAQPGPIAPAPVAYAPMGERSAVLLIPVIFGVVGAIMLLVGEFGGWYNRGYTIEETVWIYAWSVAGVLLSPRLRFHSRPHQLAHVEKVFTASVIPRVRGVLNG